MNVNLCLKKLLRTSLMQHYRSIHQVKKINFHEGKPTKIEYFDEKENIHQCNLCEKSFKSKFLLAQHKGTHTKMFGCDHCAKSFATKSSLTRHKLIHSANPPKCKICINNDKIYEGSGMSNHMRKVHGNQKNQKENNKSLKDFKKSESITNDQIEQNLHQNLKNNPLFASTSLQTQGNAVKRKRQSSKTCPAAKKIKMDSTLSEEEQKEFSQLRQQIIDLNEMIECILKDGINQPIQKENDEHTPVENQSEVLPKKLPTSRQSDETEEEWPLPKIIVHSVEILPKFIW